MKLLRHRRMRQAVKEAMDNLPDGICFFNSEGLPVLCNRKMHELISGISGRDLQVISDLEQALALRPGTECSRTLSDGSIWKFRMQNTTDANGQPYICVNAFDITTLCTEQARLRKATQAQQQTLETLSSLQKDIVASTHEEEVLALIMRLHNELGYDLQRIRRLLEKGCSAGEKEQFLGTHRAVLQKLTIREEQQADPLEELIVLADALDMRIGLTGALPEHAETRVLLSLVLRECLINTARHARGDSLTVLLRREACGSLHTKITNNGDPPKKPVTESGGLSSLRRRIEGAGGSMRIESTPVFRLIADLPQPEQGGKP